LTGKGRYFHVLPQFPVEMFYGMGVYIYIPAQEIVKEQILPLGLQGRR
jgi:hypothetical protein